MNSNEWAAKARALLNMSKLNLRLLSQIDEGRVTGPNIGEGAVGDGHAIAIWGGTILLYESCALAVLKALACQGGEAMAEVSSLMQLKQQSESGRLPDRIGRMVSELYQGADSWLNALTRLTGFACDESVSIQQLLPAGDAVFTASEVIASSSGKTLVSRMVLSLETLSEPICALLDLAESSEWEG